MITITVRYSGMNISGASQIESKLIRDAFACPAPGYEFIMRKHKKEKHPKRVASCHLCNWDGLSSQFSRNFLPIGFLDELKILLSNNNCEFQVIDDYVKPIKQYNWECAFTLRPYQVDALNALQNARCGTIFAATGGGKTKVAAASISALGLSCAIVVPRKNIFLQFVKELSENTNIPFGRIGSGLWEDEYPVVIAIMKSLQEYTSRTEDLLASKDILIVDEMHLSASESWKETLLKSNAYYRYGFSATPFRPDDLGCMTLKGICGPVVYSITTEELQDQGYLVESDIRIVQMKCTPPALVFDSTVDTETGNAIGWRKAVFTKDKYREVISQSEERNDAIAKIIKHHLACGDKIMCICAWDEHGKTVVDKLDQDVIYMSGADTLKRNATKIAEFNEKESAVIIGTSVLNEGLDLPSVNVLIIASGGNFSGRTIQQFGRGLRLNEGKNKVIVYDFLDDDRHTRKKYFYKHSINRIQTYEEIGQKPVVFSSVDAAIIGD